MTTQIADLALPGSLGGRGVPGHHHLRHPLGLRRVPAGLRGDRRAWTAGSRSRWTRGWPSDTRKTIAEARALWWMVDRPNMFIKIPATLGGTARDHRVPGRGDQRQRHADLLAGPVRRGDRRVHDRARAGARGRPRPVVDRTRWPRSSSAGWTPRWTTGWTSSARPRPGRCAARPRSPTPGWPTSCTNSGSPRRAGRRCGRRRQAAAAAVGLDEHQGSRIRRHDVRGGPGRPGHREHDAGGDAARGRRPRQAARRHRGTGLRRGPAGLRRPGAARHRLRRRGRPCSRTRASQKFAASWDGLLETIKKEMDAHGSGREWVAVSTEAGAAGELPATGQPAPTRAG